MDSRDAREADLEALAHAVARGAAQLRSWVHECSTRQRLTTSSQRVALTRWARRSDEQASWVRAREQAEVDRETRRSARRMALDGEDETWPRHAAH
jgi:hypothetical protein